MAFWSRWLSGAGAVPNATAGDPDSVGPTYRAGDPDGLVVVDDDVLPVGNRTVFVPSPWDGWPASWAAPAWQQLGPKYDELVDTAWAALDLNSTVISAMPVYRTRDGAVLPPLTWMTNPDPDIYTSWAEFAKQLFWDWQMGEAFVLPMGVGADGWPNRFRVIPPWLIEAKMVGARRTYTLGKLDVTEEILHIRYKSTTDEARGTGPLAAAGTRLVAAGVLARYASELAQGGGVPKYVLETDAELTPEQANELKEQWWASRMADLGQPWKPAVLSGGAKARPLQLSPEDMSLLGLAQYTEARISNLLGVPPFLLGLPGGDSMTYSNATSLFDFHDRRYVKPAATHVMSALSGWVVPRGQAVELNRDEYTRPPLNERADAYVKLAGVGALSAEEIRIMERFNGGAPRVSQDQLAPDPEMVAAQALTGGGRA